MNVLDKIILIHPTKCAGTTISERLFKLRGFSDNYSAFYSGFSFNRFYQSNIRVFYFIFHSKNLAMYFIYLLFYFICCYFTLRNLFSKHKFYLSYISFSIKSLINNYKYAWMLDVDQNDKVIKYGSRLWIYLNKYHKGTLFMHKYNSPTLLRNSPTLRNTPTKFHKHMIK